MTEPAAGCDGIRRVLLVGPGHRWSTWDAFVGLHQGFRAIGVESHPFQLAERVTAAQEMLAWRRERDGVEPVAAPLQDVLCVAGQDAVLRALALAADAVVVVSGLMFDARLYALLRRAGIPVFVYGTESPYNDDLYTLTAPQVAVLSTNDRDSLPALEAAVAEAGADSRVLCLPLGFNPARHRSDAGDGVEATVPAHDVVFVGNVYPSRERLLSAVDWSGVDLGLYGVFEMMDEASPLWAHVVGATPEAPTAVVDNRVAAALHARASIVLNLFREERVGASWDDVTVVGGGDGINPRMVECAAAGAFMISEWRPEVERVFGDAVPTFRTAAEAEALVRHYLARPDERERLGGLLPACVEGWSYADRARSICAELAVVRGQMRV